MLQKAVRPAVLVLHLKYKGHRYDFAVPLRSNISPSTPKEQYFALPPRPATKSKYRHGIHYAKMFPIKRSSMVIYRVNNPFSAMIKAIIDANEKEIIKACQAYLTRYENGDRPLYATDIDFLINEVLNK